MTHGHWMSGLCAAALVCALAATTPAAAQQRTYDIPPGPMREALDLFATQADVQMLYQADSVARIRSPGLRGRFEMAIGLDRLLSGTGLTWTQSRPGVVVVRGPLERAEADLPAAELDEVVVTGTLLKTSGELASPVVVLRRDDLDRRGLATVADVLTALPQNYAGSGTPSALLAGADRAGSNGVVSTGVNLRGLGPDATLVLVNGRRLGGTGFRGEFADVSALPSAAVERVDVLLDGASALYGSDAVAGVVNIILRQDFEGDVSQLFASAARGGAETVIASHLIGRTSERGSVLAAYEFQSQSALNAGDRAYTSNGDLRPFGGSDRRSLFASPGNIVAFDRASGGYVSRYAIRPPPGGAATSPADFAAGQANLLSSVRGVDLVPEIERHSVYVRARRQLAPSLEVSGDVRVNVRDYGFANAPSTAVFDVTDDNPSFVSPVGADFHTLAYSFADDLGNTRQTGRSRSLGATLGADWALDDDWSVDAYASWAEELGESRIEDRVNTVFLDEALGAVPDNPATDYRAARDGFFNPFGAGGANGRPVLDFISQGYSSARDRGRASSLNLLVEGPVADLPGGEARLAFGAQVREESFRTQTTSFVATDTPLDAIETPRGRTIAAAFAEMRVPLIGPENARPGLRRLDLSLAGRVEDYDDVGSTANPKLGLIWSPAEAWTARASWGTSFRAPALPQVFDDEAVGATLIPQANGARVLALYVYGGNRDLRPETADTWTLGLDYRPATGPRVSLTWFDTRFSDRIGQPASENLANALTDPALAPFVRRVNAGTNADDRDLVLSYITRPGFVFGTRFPPSTYGAIVDGRWVNTAEVRVSGLDLTARHAVDLAGGVLTLDAQASYLLDFESQATPTSARLDVRDRVGYPTRLRGRAGVGWARGAWEFGLAANHVSDYADAGGRTIEAWTTLDGRVAYDFSVGGGPDLSLALGVLNLADADPPFYDAPTGYGFDAGQANLLGRVWTLQLQRRW